MLRAVTALVGILAVGVPTRSAAQALCGGPPTAITVSGTVAAVHYQFAGGTDGVEAGAGVGWRGRRLEGVVTGFGVHLDDAVARPLGARAHLSATVLERWGWRLCADLLGGATDFSAEGDSGSTLAGGGGLTLATTLPVGATYVAPFVRIRGVAASVTGEVLDTSISATGAGVGGAGGLALWHGPLEVRASVALDGLAAGLGATAFPARAFRLALGWRF